MLASKTVSIFNDCPCRIGTSCNSCMPNNVSGALSPWFLRDELGWGSLLPCLPAGFGSWRLTSWLQHAATHQVSVPKHLLVQEQSLVPFMLPGASSMWHSCENAYWSLWTPKFLGYQWDCFLGSQDIYVNSGRSWEQWWLIGSDTRLWNCSPRFKSINLPSLQWTAVLRWAAIWDGTLL